jgi:hypothetical protein
MNQASGGNGGDRDRNHIGDRGNGGIGDNGDEPERAPRGGRYSGEHSAPMTTEQVALSEENEGHKLLKRMGWLEGSGLGAEGAGIIEPIRETVKKDKTAGIGSGQSSVTSTEFSSYRQQLSSEYHARMPGDRT